MNEFLATIGAIGVAFGVASGIAHVFLMIAEKGDDDAQ